MSTDHAHDHGHHESHRSWLFYTGIAVFLTAVTGLELMPAFEVLWLPPILLIGLSALKFFMVVAFFMHLWDDEKVFSQMFVAPLIGATLMVSVLMLLFHTFYPSNKDEPFVIRERYAENFSQECSSWLYSHRTQRSYCASPPITRDDLMTSPDCAIGKVDCAVTVPTRPKIGSSAKPDPEAEKAYKALSTDEERQAFLVERGQGIFVERCAACHQENGEGTAQYPPLKGAHEAYGDAQTHAGIVVHGINSPIEVLGKTYPGGGMQAWGDLLIDLDIAAVTTYERNSWGNDDGMVTPEDVAAVR